MAQPSVSHDGFVFEEIGGLGRFIKYPKALEGKKKDAGVQKPTNTPPKTREDLKEKSRDLREAQKKNTNLRLRVQKAKDKKYRTFQKQHAALEEKIQILRQKQRELDENNLKDQDVVQQRRDRFVFLSKVRDLQEEVLRIKQEVEESERKIKEDEEFYQETQKVQDDLDEEIRRFDIELNKELKEVEKLILIEEKEKAREEAKRLKEEAKRRLREEAEALKAQKKEAQKLEKEAERLQRREEQDFKRAKAKLEKMQEKAFEKKYKGKVFYFENPDQVEDTRRLTPIEKPTSYLQSFTNLFSGGRGKFYYLKGEEEYDFDESALKQIAEPILKSIETFAQKNGDLVSNAQSFKQFKDNFLIRNGYFMEGARIKTPKKFASGMDKVFYNDVRAGINQNLTAKGTYKERWGVALKEGEVRRLTFTKKKEKIVDESAMEEDDQDDEYSVYHDLLVDSSDEESDSDSYGERVRFVDDDKMNDFDSNISSALDLIKI